MLSYPIIQNSVFKITSLIPLGKFSTLTAYKKREQGVYLKDEMDDEVLLPNKYLPEDIEEGQEISVFVYTDSEDRMIATTITPKILLHHFAYLEVVDVNQYGAFLDWGLDKNLFVPFREQKQKMQTGEWHIVYLYEDETSDRLVASAKWHKFIQREILTVEEGEEVNLLVAHPTDLGRNVIINNIHAGLIFKNEIFKELKMGDRLKGYIKQIREDNKIDVRLEQQGYAKVEPNAQLILDAIKKEDGFLPLTDKSDPELIRQQLGMSKKTFKKSIGALYKQRLIHLEKEGIRLKD